MILENYYQIDNDLIRVSREQASNFAKRIANDFNPLHDVDSKRFCVPGDLLFSVILDRYGLSQHMRFVFSGMVNDKIPLNLPDTDAAHLVIRDNNGKEYLSMERDGSSTHDKSVIDALIRVYVAFSGRAFPHILVPLMEQHQVMINPDRPLIIYDSMELKLEHLNLQDPQLELSESRLEVKGKRGEAQLLFAINDGGNIVGHGTKNMVLGGLRAFDSDKMKQVVDIYRQRKENLT